MNFKDVCIESIAVSLPEEVVELGASSRSGCGPSTSGSISRSAASN